MLRLPFVQKSRNKATARKILLHRNERINAQGTRLLFDKTVFHTVINETQNGKPKNTQKTSRQSYTTQIKILPFDLGLV